MLYKFLRLKVNIYRYFEFQSNTTTDSLSYHLYTNVMICKLRKLILEVSVELKIYFIYSVCLYRMKILHLHSCCLFLVKKSKTLYSGHLVIADTFIRNRRCQLWTGLTVLYDVYFFKLNTSKVALIIWIYILRKLNTQIPREKTGKSGSLICNL